MDLVEAVGVFGPFIKYQVQDLLLINQDIKQSCSSAFDVLMNTQRGLCQRKLPKTVEKQNKER